MQPRAFRRADVRSAVPSRYGTMRDFAVWTFQAHRAIAELEIHGMKPRMGEVTIYFRTDPPLRFSEALFMAARHVQELAPVNCVVHFHQLAVGPQAGEQIGLLDG